MAYLSLSLLGPFQAWTANGVPQTFRTSKERALLAYLSVEHSQPHRRDVLSSLFWPDRPEGTARNNLRQALYGIRQVIGEPGFEAIFSISSEEVQLKIGDQVWSDLAAYNIHLKTARLHEHHGSAPCSFCLQHLRDAVELYRGPFLQDVSLEKNHKFDVWLAFCQQQYARMQIQSLETLINEYEKMGEYGQASMYAQRQLESGEPNEKLYHRLMALLARTGQYSAALEQYEIARQRLRVYNRSETGADIMLLAEQIRSGRFELPVARLETRHNLPEQLMPFVGREMELAYITHCLENPSCRLLTIVGAGGVGKSRLAIQSGQLNAGLFSDGVFFVSLDLLQSAGRLPEAIASAIGLAPGGQEEMRKTLLDYLRTKQTLLILDDFEHFLESRSLLLEILQHAPSVKLMITSRERLNYQAEFLVELNGLSFPSSDPAQAVPASRATGSLREKSPVVVDYRNFSALRLFMERVNRVRPLVERYSLAEPSDGLPEKIDPEEMEAAIRICRMVDGLPLGIELAASWARDFRFQQIADEVQRSLEFLQTTFQDLPERHRSLRASFEHSWEMLSESEREVFCKLAVFPGSFSSTAALAVAGAALPWLVRLEDKSLLRRAAPGRYDLHSLIRQFVGQKLRQYSRKVEDLAHQQHAEFFCGYLKEREAGVKGHHQADALAELDTELENIRTAWDWAIEHCSVDLLNQSAVSLMLFFEARSRWQDGEEAFGKAVTGLRTAARDGAARRVLALLLACQGWFCCRLTRYSEATSLLQESLTFLSGDEANSAGVFAHFALGFLCAWMQRLEDAWQNLLQSQMLAERMEDQWALAWSRELLCEISFESGQSGFQEEPFLAVLSMFEQIGEQRGSSRTLNYLGNIAMAQGRFESARLYYETMLANLERIGDVWGEASGYSKLGQLATASGDYEQARNLHERGLWLIQRTGDQRRMAYTLGELGEAALALGQQQDAEDTFHQALEIARSMQNQTLAQDVLTGLAAALLHARHSAHALNLLETVLAAPSGDLLSTKRAKRLLETARKDVNSDTAGPASLASSSLWDVVDNLLQNGICP